MRSVQTGDKEAVAALAIRLECDLTPHKRFIVIIARCTDWLSQGERKLAAIMFTDMVGYTALGQRNESLSLALVEEQRRIIRPILSRHGGSEVKTMGDAFLVEFPSALEAVRCAYDIQRATREFNVSLPDEKRIHLRVGIHLGDVVESMGDISGDAVNVASRIEPLAEDGGVCFTSQVHDQVRGKFELPLVSLGPRALKNVSLPVEVYRMVMPWEGGRQEGAAEADTRNIAVLPFANMSPDPSDSYFADGITEEIISTLAGVSGLSVISRTSIMGYKGTAKKLRDIGRELEVGSVLEGSFRKAGNRIRVTTQLITVSNDRHVWAQSYDRDLDDVFAVQTDIAKRVAEALRVKILTREMGRLERKPTDSAKAHSLYLMGRYHWNKRGYEDINKALEYFERAVKEDPDFALGYVGLADCHEILVTNWQADRGIHHEKAREMVARALALDPDLAEAHATNGLVLESDFALPRAEGEYRRAIELKPSYASAHQWYHWNLLAQERWDEAREQIEKAAELDPFSQVINGNLAGYYRARRDYGRALDAAKRAAELNLNTPSIRFFLAVCYGELKMNSDARREAEAAVALSEGTYPYVREITDAFLAYIEDDRETVRRLIPKLEAHLGEPMGSTATDIASFYFWLGEKERGFEWMERARDRLEPFLLMNRADKDFDSVRNDPRFIEFYRSLELNPHA